MNAPQAAEILTAHGYMTAEVQRLLDFLRAQQEGRHGRARERAGQAVDADKE